jgi:hypothetical protein
MQLLGAKNFDRTFCESYLVSPEKEIGSALHFTRRVLESRMERVSMGLSVAPWRTLVYWRLKVLYIDTRWGENIT